VSRLLAETVTLEAARDALWRIVNDEAALRRVLPGCESLEREGEGEYRAVMRTRLQFLTLHLDGRCRVEVEEPGERFTLRIDGKPRGLVGSLAVSVPVRMSDAPAGGTSASYEVDLSMSGRLAAFGAPLLRSTVLGQVRELIANVEREARQ
jgi:carbon monoxide dehydrogenase subunit G